MKKLFIAVMIMLFGLTSVYAADEQTDAVVAGKVVAIDEFARLSAEEALWVATIEVDKVVKSHQLIAGKTIQVYFLWNGKAQDDSPKHVELTKGEKAEFHLDARPLLQNKEVFFLDTEADVKS